MMPKASDNAQKVDEAIELAIEQHNDDPSAHLGTEQSLQSHRASEIIDHAARSIVGDKINTVEDVGKSDVESICTDAGDFEVQDTTQDWEIDQWVGHYCLVLEGDFIGVGKRIVSNTSDTLTLDNWDEEFFAPGDRYAISSVSGVGDWFTLYPSPLYFNGWRGVENVINTYLERTFKCNGVSIICSTGPNQGKAEIFVNDVSEGVVDLYSPVEQYRVRVLDLVYDTLEDRTVKVKTLHTKNASSTGYDVTFEGFDFNGTIAFPGLNTSILVWTGNLTTNANGYVIGTIDIPDNYGVIAYLGCLTSGHNSGSVAVPKIQIFPSGANINIILDDGQPSTTFTVKVWFTCYPYEPILTG